MNNRSLLQGRNIDDLQQLTVAITANCRKPLSVACDRTKELAWHCWCSFL